MFRVVQSHAVGEVGGLAEAQLLQLFVHQHNKGLLGPGHVGGKTQGGVGTGGEDGAIQQFPDGNGLAHLQPHHAAVVDVAVVGDVDGHGESVIQVGDVLGTHQEREDLGHGCGADHSPGILFRQYGAVFHIHHHGIGAGELFPQLDGVRCLTGGVNCRRLRLLGRDLRRHGLGLVRRCFGLLGLPLGHPGAQQEQNQYQQQEKGKQLQKLPPAAGLLLFFTGCHARFAPGGPLFFCQWGGVFAVHVRSPVFCVLFSSL